MSVAGSVLINTSESVAKLRPGAHDELRAEPLGQARARGRDHEHDRRPGQQRGAGLQRARSP